MRGPKEGWLWYVSAAQLAVHGTDMVLHDVGARQSALGAREEGCVL